MNIIAQTENLPALLSRAGQRLLDARTSAEVLEAKKIAEMALALAKVIAAANETHADCLRIITRAEIRMADEIDADPTIARNGQHGEAVQTSDSLGLDRRRISEWRETRDAGEDVIEEAINGALAEGRAPTKADIRNHVRGTFGTGENEWYTPAEHIELARRVLGKIDLDPASSKHAQKTVRASCFYTEDLDGLKMDWVGSVWLNPPYAQPHIAKFADKMIFEWHVGRVKSAIVLTHNYTDTVWFHKLAAAANAICFTRGRVRFVSPSGELAAPTQGQAFFYFGKRANDFADVFKSIGFVANDIV